MISSGTKRSPAAPSKVGEIYILTWWWWWWCPLCTKSIRSIRTHYNDSGPFGHIIMTPGQTMFALAPSCCVFRGKATKTNIIVLYLTRPGLELTICRNENEHANYSLFRGDVTSPNNNESAILGGEAITWIRMASVENKWVIYKLSGN